MVDLVATVLKILIFIVGGIIKRINMTKDQKKAFYEFVEKMDRVYVPAKLKSEGERQLEILKQLESNSKNK